MLARRRPTSCSARRSTRVERAARAGRSWSATAPGGRGRVAVDEILVGAGRVPNVEGLGLEAAGVAYDQRQGVEVNDHLQTTQPRIYAAGDVCSRLPVHPHGRRDGADRDPERALLRARKALSALTIPWCTYTDPEIAHVGLYAKDAESTGIAVETLTVPLRDVDRAVLDGEDEGFVKVHVQRGDRQDPGRHDGRRHAGDMIDELSLAMAGGHRAGALAAGRSIPYPTQAEAIRQTGDMYNRTRLTPRVRKLFAAWLRWTR